MEAKAVGEGALVGRSPPHRLLWEQGAARGSAWGGRGGVGGSCLGVGCVGAGRSHRSPAGKRRGRSLARATGKGGAPLLRAGAGDGGGQRSLPDGCGVRRLGATSRGCALLQADAWASVALGC